MKQLIVNADDFGMTDGVNRGILEAHSRGIVTSTTLLANGEAFAAAVALGRGAPRLGVGVHLNLSEGPPVAQPQGGRSTLLNRQGRLHLTPGKLFAAIAGRRVLLADVEAELRAQARKVIDAGITPTHVDGHMHVHVLPGVSEMVVNIAREFSIPAIRCPIERAVYSRRGASANSTQSSRMKRRSIAWAVSFAALRLRWLARRAGLIYPAPFYGIAETGVLDSGAVEQILRELPATPGASELMCHPGYVDAALAQVGGELQGQRHIELEALTAPAIVEQVAQNGIRLIHYGDLTAPRNDNS